MILKVLIMYYGQMRIIIYGLNKNNENSTNHNFNAKISNDVKLRYSAFQLRLIYFELNSTRRNSEETHPYTHLIFHYPKQGKTELNLVTVNTQRDT